MERTCYGKRCPYSVEKDIVAFWTETRVLSGVVHFDRGENGNEILDVYLHPNNDKKLYKVDKTDILQLIRFLSEEGFTSAGPLLRTACDDPILIFDAQRQGIYRVKDLANSLYITTYRHLSEYQASRGA
ncbi:hypothetical protein TWF506_006359 [Arthrobotrys conoides]|uniref:Uncharacterized protein n=1 Tax=Arthrobotrys conoides TaxID=74498 RepID=A0AAN8RNY1_9PEZI